MNLVAKLDNASFKQNRTTGDSTCSLNVSCGFDFNIEIYKDNNHYKTIITPTKQTESNANALSVEETIIKLGLNIYIGNKNIFSSPSTIGNYMEFWPYGPNSIHYYRFQKQVIVEFDATNIDVTNLKISISCYEYEYSFNAKYTFEQSFKVPLTNKAPEINSLQANFPNVSFNVSDDKKVSKVEVFINNSLQKTIVNGLNNKINLTFTRNDFKIGENIIILRATDNDNVFTNKTINVKKGKIPIPKKGIEIVKKNKIYKIVSSEEKVESDELILTLDRNLEEVSSLGESIEILDKYAIVKINDKPMKHISSKNIENDEVEDKFELDITTRKVKLRVDLERVDSYGSIYIKEIQEAFQYNKD